MKLTSMKTVFYRGDEASTQQVFQTADSRRLSGFIGSADVLIIDEAQAIPNIGQTLKIINDTHDQLSVVVTGSSSFELAGQIGEPLTGRKKTHHLYPLSLGELLSDAVAPIAVFQQHLPDYLVYGMYPDAITAKGYSDKRDFLVELVESYLLRDILAFNEVKGSHLLLQLLSLLAYQMGNEVSLSELGSTLGIDKNTVGRYLDLLEKSYIIFRLGGFSRNLRSEVTRTAKYYFYDIGVRNAIINNFNPLDRRNDVGQLWEGFAIAERLKTRAYHKIYANQYFWRTWSRQEIDLIEERDGALFAYEFKWNAKKLPSPPREWQAAYGDEAHWQIISPDNLLDFVVCEQ